MKLLIFKESKIFQNAALVLLVLLALYNAWDRQKKAAEIIQATRNTASIHRARAEIQNILINASVEGRKLSPTEVDRIKVLLVEGSDPAAETPK